MIKSLFTSIVVLFLLNSPLAAENRIEALENSYLIEALQKKDPWEVTFSTSTVTYKCSNCPSPVSTLIQVKKVESKDLLPSSIINARKALCAKLATENGRCVSANSFRKRGSAIKGFRFELEQRDKTIIQLQFPYLETGREPELIAAKIVSERGVELPRYLEETLLEHMARLTIFW